MNVTMVNEAVIKADNLQMKSEPAEATDAFASELGKAKDAIPQQKSSEPAKSQNPGNGETEETAAAEKADPVEVCLKVILGSAGQGETVEMVNPNGKGDAEKTTQEPTQEDLQGEADGGNIPLLIPVIPIVQENTQSIPGMPVTQATVQQVAANLAGLDVKPQQGMTEAAVVVSEPAANSSEPAAQVQASGVQTVLTPETQSADSKDFAAVAMKEIKSMLQAEGKEKPQQETVQTAAAKTEIQSVKGESQPAFEGESRQNEQKQQQAPATGQQHSQSVLTAFVNPEGKVDIASSVAQMQEQPGLKQTVMSQVVEQVTTAVSNEKSEMSVQLKPEHLGGLTISLVMEESGLTAKLLTTEQSVQHMIRAEMASLQETLRDKGINVVHMEVICDQTMNMAGNNQAKSGGRWESGYFAGGDDSFENSDETVSFLNNLSRYDVLTEQGGSVEFSA